MRFRLVTMTRSADPVVSGGARQSSEWGMSVAALAGSCVGLSSSFFKASESNVRLFFGGWFWQIGPPLELESLGFGCFGCMPNGAPRGPSVHSNRGRSCHRSCYSIPEGGSAHVADPRNRCRLTKSEVLGICSNFEGTHRMKFGEKRSKNCNCFQQSLFRNAVNISVLAFVSLLQRKMQKLEFVGIYKVLCTEFFSKHRKYQRFFVKYRILHMWCCKSRANSGVLATLAVFGVAKTS